MATDVVSRLAAVLLAAEGLGVLGLAAWEIAALAAGDTGSLSSAIALLVLTALGGVAILAFAVAVWRGLSWGRSGGIVTQLLILAVALGAATGAYAAPTTAAALAVPALVVLALLVLAVRRAAPARERPSADG
jgi:hypothetical protein